MQENPYNPYKIFTNNLIYAVLSPGIPYVHPPLEWYIKSSSGWRTTRSTKKKEKENARKIVEKRPNDGHKWINSPVSAPEATQDARQDNGAAPHPTPKSNNSRRECRRFMAQTCVHIAVRRRVSAIHSRSRILSTLTIVLRFGFSCNKSVQGFFYD